MSSKARRVTDSSAVEPYAWDTTDGPMRSGATLGQPATGSRTDGADQQMKLGAIEREAFAKGYAQGERAGTEAAAVRADAMLRRLTETLDELAALRAEMIRRTERQIVQLVLAIAERIVHRETTLDRTLLIGMARAALDRLGDHASATIRLHPDDHAAVSAAQTLIESPQVRIVADPVVSRGGCLVQSDFGFMDASPESQFRELARALLQDVDSPRESESDSSHGTVLK